MRWRDLRQLALRLQQRSGELETLLAARGKAAAGERTLQRAIDLNRLNVRDCRRMIALANAGRRELSDAELVEQQLLDAVRMRILESTALHPWGSTLAAERLLEPELESETVAIPVETEILPHVLQADWHRANVALALEFQLSHVVRLRSTLRQAVYHVTLKSPPRTRGF